MEGQAARLSRDGRFERMLPQTDRAAPGHNPAPDGPGIEPRWTRARKDAVGTARSPASHVWYTLSLGILNEVYYPTIDRPQIRDLQYLVTDGETFFLDERRLDTTTEPLSEHSLGYRVVNRDPDGRFAITKEIIADPELSAVVIRTSVVAEPALRDKLRLFALCAPHLEVGGWDNNGEVTNAAGRQLLLAHKHGTWLALGADSSFLRSSVGYVGVNDGWQDLADNYVLDWEYDRAGPGNIALIGEIDLGAGSEFTLALAFGRRRHGAITALQQALGVDYAHLRRSFVAQWESTCGELLPLEKATHDDGKLYHASQALLLAHEDKVYPGAMIASLSIPWGEARGDEELGGYHLVWTRDMVNSVTGLLATGDTETPLRALIYLASSQLPDGGFHQNFWISGDPHWTGVQLDEVAFPILLAWRLHRIGALQNFDPYPMVLRAAGYLVTQGPATPQERWEEASGYSPSTLASNIAALTCAASFARQRGDAGTADFLQEYADFLECHIEDWTVTTQGTLVPEIPRHFIRILPDDAANPQPAEDPDRALLTLANRPPGSPHEFPARDIVDAGFLELVRYGIRRAGDPLFEDSLAVVDATLEVDTPFGPCWHRYNHDGYGQRADGGPYLGWGVGRAWPLLVGERGHYELAAGRDVAPYVAAMERFATGTGLLPEQVWDEADRPDQHLYLGQPTGAAMPLMWAHAEYVKLLRSRVDGEVFSLVPEVVARYQGRSGCRALEVWKLNRRVSQVAPGRELRIQAPGSFRLHWTNDDWQTVATTPATTTSVGIGYVDVPVTPGQRAPVRFTFRWEDTGRWQGEDYTVEVG